MKLAAALVIGVQQHAVILFMAYLYVLYGVQNYGCVMIELYQLLYATLFGGFLLTEYKIIHVLYTT